MEGGGSCSLNSRLQHIQIRLRRVRTWSLVSSLPRHTVSPGFPDTCCEPMGMFRQNRTKNATRETQIPLSLVSAMCQGGEVQRPPKGKGQVPARLPGGWMHSHSLCTQIWVFGGWKWLLWLLPTALPSPCAAGFCIQGLPATPSPPKRPQAAAGLSCSHRGGCQGCAQTRTLPGAGAAARREPQQEATPSLPSPKAIKNEAHSAAQLSSHQITAHETVAAPSSPAGAGNAT